MVLKLNLRPSDPAPLLAETEARLVVLSREEPNAGLLDSIAERLAIDSAATPYVSVSSMLCRDGLRGEEVECVCAMPKDGLFW